MLPLTVHYNTGLVLVSILLSLGASYVALSLSDRVREAASRGFRHLWIACGAFAMGTGIWSMHYLGMLAVVLPVPVFYHWPTVILSLLLAILAANVALSLVNRPRMGSRQLLLGGIFMGSGIGGMHYVGMAAMRSAAMEHYNPWIVLLSLVIATGFSSLALWVAFISRRNSKHPTLIRITAATVMGLAISAMHYIAMWGVHFTPSLMPFDTRNTAEVGQLGTWVIAIVTTLILLAALSTSTMNKWRFDDLQIANQELLVAQTELLEIQRQLTDANHLLSELSVRDGLTGLYNRRHFDSALETELRRASRSKQPISLLMIDVDLFKSLNDEFGHQRGDDCLREVARVLNEHPRRGYDVAARYGGEEFALLLPDAGHEAAFAIAESIRQGVLNLNIENPGSTVANVLSVSIGVCCRAGGSREKISELVRGADLALYAAKRLGRNRVEIAAEVVA